MGAPEDDPDIWDYLGQATPAMFEGRFEEAAALYERILGLNPRKHDVDPFWLLMSIGESCFRRGAWEQAMDAYHRAFSEHEEAALGNPLFHLRVGQCQLELQAGGAMDNLARALIGGGIELFDDEEPEYLAAIVEVLRPPADATTWEATRGQGGATRDKLDGAIEQEFLWDMLESRGVVKTPDRRGLFSNPKYWKPES
jgi:tetratricopeptide (TPR) repeat protein